MWWCGVGGGAFWLRSTTPLPAARPRPAAQSKMGFLSGSTLHYHFSIDPDYGGHHSQARAAAAQPAARGTVPGPARRAACPSQPAVPPSPCSALQAGDAGGSLPQALELRAARGADQRRAQVPAAAAGRQRAGWVGGPARAMQVPGMRALFSWLAGTISQAAESESAACRATGPCLAATHPPAHAPPPSRPQTCTSRSWRCGPTACCWGWRRWRAPAPPAASGRRPSTTRWGGGGRGGGLQPGVLPRALLCWR